MAATYQTPGVYIEEMPSGSMLPSARWGGSNWERKGRRDSSLI